MTSAANRADRSTTSSGRDARFSADRSIDCIDPSQPSPRLSTAQSTADRTSTSALRSADGRAVTLAWRSADGHAIAPVGKITVISPSSIGEGLCCHF